MSIKTIKIWINIITIGALLLLFYFARDQIREAFATFGRLNLLWLFMVIPLQLSNYFMVAKFYQSSFASLGERLRLKELYKVGLEMNFINNVFPSGGVSGFGYFGIRIKKLGVKGSKSTLVQTSRHFLTFLSFTIFLFFGLLLLAIFGSASRFLVMIVSITTTLILIGTALLLYIISDSRRVKAASTALPHILNKIVHFFRKKKKQTINVEKIEKLFGELHLDFLQAKSNWRSLRRPFFWTLMMNLTEILTIVVVYWSFGSYVNVGAIIIAYAVANVAGLVSILPGGIGVYEGLMTAVMASAGVPKALALSATVVYRVFNMALFLPIGYFFYQRALAQGDIDSSTIAGIEQHEQ